VTATATATATATPTATVTPTRTLTPTVTLTPTATRVMKYQAIEYIRRVDGSRYTIGEITVDTDGATQLVNDPSVGDKVEAYLVQRSDGSYLALEIRAIAKADSTPEPRDFTGKIESMQGEWWVVGGQRVRVPGDVSITGTPRVGFTAEVKAEVRRGEAVAKSIKVLARPDRDLDDTLRAWGGDWCQIGRSMVLIDSQTQISGDPVVGRRAQARVWILEDGRLLADVIVISEEPEATATATLRPTATATPRPSATVTSAPTATATQAPAGTTTPSASPAPTATRTP
jgi:hypothetical protein